MGTLIVSKLMHAASEKKSPEDATHTKPTFVSQARKVIASNWTELTPGNPRWWVAFTRLLMRRVKEQQLPQVASSLTFTTVLSLVPMATVALAIFTAFPMFQRLQADLQNYLLGSFFPDTLSSTILQYVNQFSEKAKGLTAIGIVFLVITALSTMLTVDKVFNQIWHVKRHRSLVSKILLYWAVITLAPMLIGLSLSVSTALLGESLKGVAPVGGTHLLLSVVPLLCTVVAFAFLYQIIPNRAVRMGDALVGGVVAAVLFEFSKRAFAAYITHFPSYTALYGALAAFPIFLLWIYVSWIIVLLGAATVAALPVARTGHWQAEHRPGQRWLHGISILSELERARQSGKPGMTMEELRLNANVSPDQLDDILTVLIQHDVVGLLSGSKTTERFAMICDPRTQSAELVAKLLWFDVALQQNWQSKLPKGTEKLGGFVEEFVKKPRLLDWLEV
ncbi:YihY family inner membrane protein [Limnobacter sp.]|nr:YihY family inner membrane protein [Limnobacter sp.]